MDEYALVAAAKYFGVAPWTLAEMPIHWQNLALALMEDEAEGLAEREKRWRGVR